MPNESMSVEAMEAIFIALRAAVKEPVYLDFLRNLEQEITRLREQVAAHSKPRYDVYDNGNPGCPDCSIVIRYLDGEEERFQTNAGISLLPKVDGEDFRFEPCPFHLAARETTKRLEKELAELRSTLICEMHSDLEAAVNLDMCPYCVIVEMQTEMIRLERLATQGALRARKVARDKLDQILLDVYEDEKPLASAAFEIIALFEAPGEGQPEPDKHAYYRKVQLLKARCETLGRLGGALRDDLAYRSFENIGVVVAWDAAVKGEAQPASPAPSPAMPDSIYIEAGWDESKYAVVERRKGESASTKS